MVFLLLFPIVVRGLGLSISMTVMCRHDGQQVESSTGGLKIFMSSFRSNVVRIRVQKKTGMENADLLAEAGGTAEAEAGIWGKISDTISKCVPLFPILLFFLFPRHPSVQLCGQTFNSLPWASCTSC